MIIGKT